MQVSWIEPDQLRDLVGQLQQPAGKTSNLAWELHTLPNPTGLGARELGIEDGDLWLPDDQATALAPIASPIEPVEELFSPALAVENLRQEVALPPSPEPSPAPVVEELDDPPIEQPKELNRIREKLQAIRERAIEAGLLAHVGVTPEARVEEPSQPIAEPETPPVAEVAESLLPISSPFALAEPEMEAPPSIAPESQSGFEVPPGTLTHRLEAFAVWAARQLGVHDMLIVDDHGDVLWGQRDNAGLVVSAMMACKAAMRSSALGAAGLSNIIEQPISIDRMLVIVPCETGYGALSIAFVREGDAPQSDALLLRDALVRTIETRTAPPPPPVGGALD